MSANNTPNKLTVAGYIKHQLEICGRPQKDIAKEAGFTKNNMISMLKSGDTKLSLSRAPALARALHVDPRYLMLLCIEEYMPEVYEAMKAIMHQPVLTDNELEILSLIREANPNNPKAGTENQKEAVRELAMWLKPDSVVPTQAQIEESWKVKEMRDAARNAAKEAKAAAKSASDQ